MLYCVPSITLIRGGGHGKDTIVGGIRCVLERVQPLIPALPKRYPDKDYKRKSGGGRKPMDSRKVLRELCMY